MLYIHIYNRLFGFFPSKPSSYWWIPHTFTIIPGLRGEQLCLEELPRQTTPNFSASPQRGLVFGRERSQTWRNKKTIRHMDYICNMDYFYGL
jgi:hypothetical protein